MKTLNSFLTEFNNQLNVFGKKRFSCLDLQKAIDEKKLLLSDLEVFDLDQLNFNYIPQLQTVIDSIISISMNPNFELKEDLDTRKREQVVKTDAKSVIMTSKKMSYWQVDVIGEKLTPQKMIATVNEVTYGTYENKFVVMLIDLLLTFVNKQIALTISRVPCLNDNFITNNTFYSDVRDITKDIDFKALKAPKYNKVKQSMLISGKNDFELPLLNLTKIRASLYNLMNSRFYKDVKKAGPFNVSRLQRTNVFNDQRDYKICYDFYKVFREINRKIPVFSEINRLNYRDYVAVRLVEAFNQLGFEFENKPLHFETKHMEMNNLEAVSKDGIICTVKTNQNDIELTFEIKYLHGKFHKTEGLSKKRVAKVVLVLNPLPLIDANKEDYAKTIKETIDRRISKGYDNAFAVLPDVGILRDDVVTVTPSSIRAHNSLINAISSCLVFIEANQDLYSKICPVCGNKISAQEEDGTYHCPHCESAYSFLISGDNNSYKTTLWIKRLKVKEE